jgi:hypothetical protein
VELQDHRGKAEARQANNGRITEFLFCHAEIPWVEVSNKSSNCHAMTTRPARSAPQATNRKTFVGGVLLQAIAEWLYRQPAVVVWQP